MLKFSILRENGKPNKPKPNITITQHKECCGEYREKIKTLINGRGGGKIFQVRKLPL